MSLQAKLDAFKADFEAGKPPFSVPRSVIETMHRATAELVASGAASRAKKAGDIAPDFSLKDPKSKAVSSADLLKRGPLVVSFYRGVWCPYCNMEDLALFSARFEAASRVGAKPPNQGGRKGRLKRGGSASRSAANRLHLPVRRSIS